MNPQSGPSHAAPRPQFMNDRHLSPSPPPSSWSRWLVVLVVACALALPATADAQRKKKRRKKRKADKTTEVTTKGKGKTKVFDFTGLELGGRLRTPQLLYFLDRAEQELDRAALEKRSFIPEMARSMEEEAL